MAAEASESKVISIKIEFSGGAELLFGNEKRIHVTLPLKNDDWNLRDLIEWLKINHLKERPELFVQNDTVRPGILVLVNDTDWELLGQSDYRINNNDNIMFISTLHGVKPLMKYLKSEHYMYINDDTVAKTVMKHLSDNLSTEKSIIFEASPGIGILTEKLLENGARRVRVFENNEKHLGILKKLSIKYPKQLDVCNQQILSLPSLTYKYWETDEQSIKNLFIAVPKHLWNDVPTIKFVSVLSPIMATRFLRFILRQLVLKSYFFTDGRTQFLLFFSGTEHTYMFAKHSENFLYYRAVTVLYNTLFHIESLETVPWNCFQPNVIHQKIKKMQFDRNNACLVRLTPKTILDQFSPELLCDYYYFVSQTFMRRKNWIIPFLEKWFPNCGPQLIKKGIPVFKYFGDLSPQEVFDLFIHCTNLPEYSSSIFKAASKSAMTSYQKVEFDDESECSDSDNDGEINDQTEEKT